MIRVLLIGGSPEMVRRVRDALAPADHAPVPGAARFHLEHAATTAEGLEAIRAEAPHAVLLDPSRPPSRPAGLAGFIPPQASALDIPVLILADELDGDLATRCLEGGAQDVLFVREISPAAFGRAVLNAVIRTRTAAARRSPGPASPGGAGASPGEGPPGEGPPGAFVPDERTGSSGVPSHLGERRRPRDGVPGAEARLRRYNRALVELAGRLALPYDREADFQEIVEVASRDLDVRRSAIWLLTPDGTALRRDATYPGAHRDTPAEIRIREHPAYFAALQSAWVIARGDTAGVEASGGEVPSVLVAGDATSSLHAPIRLHGRLVGLLCSESPGPPRTWQVEDQAFAAALASHVSLSLEAAERAAAQEALRHSEARLTQILEALPLAVLVVGEDGKLQYVNREARRLLEEADGGAPLALRHAYVAGTEDPYPALGLAMACALGGDARAMDDIELRHDGSVVSLHARAAPLRDPHGAVVGAVATFVDVTDRVQLESRLRQASKLEAVGRLAGGVAHDFNNLLTTIRGNADLLLMDLAAETPIHEDLQEIRRAADRAADLTRQLLAFSRHQVLKPLTVDLCSSVRTTERMLTRLIPEDVALVMKLQPGAGSVLADPTQVEQVILNLVLNARDAMAAGGVLTIEVCNAEPHHLDGAGPERGEAGMEYVLLAVTDTGEGIDPRIRERIFEPFYTTKGVGQGTGLGLATVYGIVQQSGGFIRVESARGRGTSFRVYLPRVAERPRAAPPEAAVRPPSAAGRGTVLLVEDEDPVRRIAARTLRLDGYTVLEASGPEEALRVLGDHPGPVDLLLTDVVMPGGSGRDLGERIQAQRTGIRVLYMSGYTEDVVLRNGVARARVEFLQKPFSAEELTECVRRVLAAS